MPRLLRSRLALVLVFGCLPPVLVAACVATVSSGVDIREENKNALVREVTVPVRAHLVDGSTMLYPDGIRVVGTTIVPRRDVARIGPLNQTMMVSANPMPLDSIVGLESYQRRTNVPGTLVLSTLGAVGSTLGTALGLALVFGSCPTIYADSAGTAVLQAEVFATRISPLLEARDIDLLGVIPDSNGVLTLEVRNEALETHYINQFEVLEIRHARSDTLIPDEHGRPLLIGARRPPVQAVDRAGRDRTLTVARIDDDVFSTDSVTLARASGADPFDFLDVVVPRPPADSAVVTLRLRNSLLNTVLLYDFMLAAPGAGSIEWLTRDMRRIGPMFQFGRWYREHFGLRVSVYDGARWREIERHPTYGPVAWRDAATVVPVLERDSLRVRLRFAADEWRIDQVAVADRFRRPRTRTLAIRQLAGLPDSTSANVMRSLREADERYVETFPGQRFWMSFDAGLAPIDSTRSFLLASQGHYSEWVRASWVKNATDYTTFSPGPAALDRTFARWREKRDSIDAAFFATRVPVASP